jgi:hypothetical protein
VGIRTETTFNDPTDVQRTKGLATLPNLREVGRRINQRLPEAEYLSHSFAVSTPMVDRIQQPIGVGSRRVAGLRLSDPRVLALLQALCSFSYLPLGFRNRDLRPQVAHLLGRDLAHYSPGAMTYDLRRLRLHGLIERVPHTFRYVVTPTGLQLAFVVSRVYLRLLHPDWSDITAIASTNDLPEPLRTALAQLDAALRLLTAPSTSPAAHQPRAA